jgi:hypothetical protein
MSTDNKNLNTVHTQVNKCIICYSPDNINIKHYHFCQCQHYFCEKCYTEYIKTHTNCPNNCPISFVKHMRLNNEFIPDADKSTNIRCATCGLSFLGCDGHIGIYKNK